jgi:hypothetical protein
MAGGVGATVVRMVGCADRERSDVFSQRSSRVGNGGKRLRISIDSEWVLLFREATRVRLPQEASSRDAASIVST